MPPRHGSPRHDQTLPSADRAWFRARRSPPECSELGREITEEAISTAQNKIKIAWRRLGHTPIK
jgi:hypothetical protein